MTQADPTLLLAIVLVAIAIGLALVRSRPMSVKLAYEVLAMSAILFMLVDRGASPLPVWLSLAARPDGVVASRTRRCLVAGRH